MQDNKQLWRLEWVLGEKLGASGGTGSERKRGFVTAEALDARSRGEGKHFINRWFGRVERRFMRASSLGMVAVWARGGGDVRRASKPMAACGRKAGACRCAAWHQPGGPRHAHELFDVAHGPVVVACLGVRYGDVRR